MAKACVSVIIVSWNVRGPLGDCLRALYETSSDWLREVVVVDNASDDGSADMVDANFPSVTVIRLPSNMGFPTANNIGLRRASGDWALLLNPDTRVQVGCIDRCLSAATGRSEVGVVGCKLLYPDGTLQYECAANLPSIGDCIIETFYLHVLFPRSRVFGRALMGSWNHESDRLVPRISGAFMLIHRRVFEKVGELDNGFFMYYEDIDYCARVAEAGWKILYVASAVTVHLSGQSRRQSQLKFDDLAPQVRHTFFLRHRGVVAAIVFRTLYLFQTLLRIPIACAAIIVLPRKSVSRHRSFAKPAVHVRRLAWCLTGWTVDELRRNTRTLESSLGNRV